MKGYKHRRHQRYNKRFDRLKTRLDRISGNGLYRSRDGIFMGVCRGVGEYFNFSVFWTRIITLLIFLITGFWPIGVLYLIAGLILKVEPVSPFHTEQDHDFYENYTQSRTSAVQRLKRKFENIERRIQRMEHTVTSKEFNWK